jgi:hypothetical protein
MAVNLSVALVPNGSIVETVLEQVLDFGTGRPCRHRQTH